MALFGISCIDQVYPYTSVQDYSFTESVYYCHQENYVFISVYSKHFELSLWVSHFLYNITIAQNLTIESILTITKSTYFKSLQVNNLLHKVTQIIC